MNPDKLQVTNAKSIYLGDQLLVPEQVLIPQQESSKNVINLVLTGWGRHGTIITNNET